MGMHGQLSIAHGADASLLVEREATQQAGHASLAPLRHALGQLLCNVLKVPA